MFTEFNKRRRRIFLDPLLPCETQEGSAYEVVLSPALYWVRRFDVPLTNLKEVKKVLGSLFEEILPEGNYSYDAYFDEEGLVAFAYDDAHILALLQEKGVAPGDVKSVAFAQSVLHEQELPAKLDDTRAIIRQDGVCVIVPLALVQDARPLQLHDEKFTHSVALRTYSQLIDQSSFLKLTAVLAALVVLFCADWFVSYMTIREYERKSEALLAQKGVMPTLMQNNSLLKKYERIHAKQQHLREFFSSLFQLKLASKEYLQKLTVGKQKVQMEFANVKAKERFVRHFSNFEVTKAELKSGRLYMEVAL